jgi:hypothetical protein
MKPLPATDLRSNRGTWAVPAKLVPALAHALTTSLPPEVYDPGFRGQGLETTYFDTAHFDLRRARKKGDRYLTLRVRCYQPGDTYALSAKTEDGKFRLPIDAHTAASLLQGNITAGVPGLLPADLLARLLDLTGGKPLVPVVAICFQRYAVEDDIDRFTLDLGTVTDTGKAFPAGVLEFKSQVDDDPPAALTALGLRPIKLSKFLWATGYSG